MTFAQYFDVFAHVVAALVGMILIINRDHHAIWDIIGVLMILITACALTTHFVQMG